LGDENNNIDQGKNSLSGDYEIGTIINESAWEKFEMLFDHEALISKEVNLY